MQLIRNGLNEIQKNDNNNNVELFYTIRNIVSLYCDLMPLKHNTLLKSIPQQAGKTKPNEFPIFSLHVTSLAAILSPSVCIFSFILQQLHVPSS